jgi:hypothetical protein
MLDDFQRFGSFFAIELPAAGVDVDGKEKNPGV